MACICHECKTPYYIDLNIPDELWQRIGMPEHSGLLCGICIMKRLESFKQYGYLLVDEGDVN